MADQRLQGFESAQAPLEAGAPPPDQPDDGLKGPFAVGAYAHGLRDWLRKRDRLKLIGEITGLRFSRKSVYFDLRDARGAVNCSIWLSDWERLRLPDGAARDGAEVIVTGGPDYYPGSATASPAFSFRCTDLRLAGEGDLLAQLAALRRKLEGEGLFDPQRRLPRPALPETIGIVTARGSAAEADLLAALERRGWRGRIVFAHPPVQDRHAAPMIARALTDLAGIPEVEVIVVARGGGSLADLWAFCDESLCRTVALLRLPVISAIGHESDRTLLDDVAAVSCSTPTHAIEEAVRVDVAAARARIAAGAAALGRHGAAAAPATSPASPARSAITPTVSAAACIRRSARSAPPQAARSQPARPTPRVERWCSPANVGRRCTAPTSPAMGWRRARRACAAVAMPPLPSAPLRWSGSRARSPPTSPSGYSSAATRSSNRATARWSAAPSGRGACGGCASASATMMSPPR